MKVRNNFNRKEYTITEGQWNKLKAEGKWDRYTVISDDKKSVFVPKELKVESQPEGKSRFKK